MPQPTYGYQLLLISASGFIGELSRQNSAPRRINPEMVGFRLLSCGSKRSEDTSKNPEAVKTSLLSRNTK